MDIADLRADPRPGRDGRRRGQRTCWRTRTPWWRVHEGTPLYVELPASVELTITYTEPGCRATGPPAAPSRPRWRPAPRSRCRCSSPPARRSRSTPATAATSAGSPAEPGSDGRPQQGPQARPRRALRGRAARRRRARRRWPTGSRRPTRRCREYTVELVEGVVGAPGPDRRAARRPTPQGWTLDRMPAVDRNVLRLGDLRAALARRRPGRGGHRRGGRAGRAAVDRRLAARSSTACSAGSLELKPTSPLSPAPTRWSRTVDGRSGSPDRPDC